MACIRWDASVPLLVAFAAWLGPAGCGGETATGGVAAAPAPSVSMAPPPGPPPAPPAAAGPMTSAAGSVAPMAGPTPSAGQGAEMAEADEHRDRHYGGVLMLVAMSIKDLDLAADQRAIVEKVREDLLSKMEPARAAAKELANTLADGISVGSVDRAKADAGINKLAAQVQGIHDASVAALNQLHTALNAQQRAALVDSLQAHWEKWKEAHGQDEQSEQKHRSGYLLGLVKTIGLTKEQAEAIKANFHEKMKSSPQEPKHKDVDDHLQAFATAFKAETFDAKKLTGGKMANAHLARWGATRRERFLEAAAPVLTPEQRTKLAQMIRDHASRAES
jgi:Spy/CpxP family protein refolding chaperone